MPFLVQHSILHCQEQLGWEVGRQGLLQNCPWWEYVRRCYLRFLSNCMNWSKLRTLISCPEKMSSINSDAKNNLTPSETKLSFSYAYNAIHLTVSSLLHWNHISLSLTLISNKSQYKIKMCLLNREIYVISLQNINVRTSFIC